MDVRRLKDRATGGWAAIETGFTGGTITDIQAIVDLKEPKTTSYLARCDVSYRGGWPTYLIYSSS